jgi:alkylation response protein AidB-like acyl-CoA dehydrogenase
MSIIPMSTIHTFARTDEQQMLAETLARLLSEEHGFEARRRQQPGCGQHPAWPALVEIGVIGAAFDESHGGFAGDARTVAVVMAELGAALVFEPFMEAAVVAGRIFQHWADDSARRAAIEALINGTRTVVVAHSPTGNADARASVRALQADHRTALTGNITCVRHAPLAGGFLIPAIAADGSTEIYQVPRECPGLVLETYRLIDGAIAADLHLRNVTIQATARMRFDMSAQAVIDDALEWGILASVAETASILQALNHATFSYLMTRKQFGVPLGTFQALQHRASDMYMAAEETLAVVDEAVDSFSSGPAHARSALVSAAKVVADTAARRIGDGAVQMHGGMGVSDELIVSHYARRLIALRCGLGGADAHRLRFGSLLH